MIKPPNTFKLKISWRGRDDLFYVDQSATVCIEDKEYDCLVTGMGHDNPYDEDELTVYLVEVSND